MPDHHHHHSNVANSQSKNLRLAFLLNFIFTVVEIIGGFLTNSMAILSDALHDFGRITRSIEEVAQVISVHDVHIWSMDGEYNVLSAHIVVDDETTSQQIIEIKKDIRYIIRDLDIIHETLEIEYNSEICDLEDC